MALTDMVIMPGADYQSMCDSIRALDGSTDVIKSGDYSGKVQAVSDTVDTQADLIAQIKSEHETQIAAIKTALEGKTAGGSGGAAVETCTVTVPTSGEYRVGATCYKDGAFEAVLFLPVEDGAEIENVVKGTSLCIFDVNSATAPSIENANYIATSPYYGDIHPLSLHVYQVATQ